MNLFLSGDFTLHSGKKSNYLIDCNALDDGDIGVIARRLVERIGPFGHVKGIPQGGCRIAAALAEHIVDGHPAILIADDVWTTGRSMYDAREVAQGMLGGDLVLGAVVLGAVIFQRGYNTNLPYWVTAFGIIGI